MTTPLRDDHLSLRVEAITEHLTHAFSKRSRIVAAVKRLPPPSVKAARREPADPSAPLD